MNLGCELKALDDMNRLVLWMISTIWIMSAQASTYYEALRIVDDMNDSTSLAQTSKCYE